MKLLGFVFLLIASVCGFAEGLKDSTKATVPSRRSKARLTIRLHSLGYFSYTGRMISSNPAVDLNFNYERKNWGLLVFKALDLYDHLTPNNFTLAMIYKNIPLSKRLTITPYVGASLDQSHEIADKGSDVTAIITTSLKVNRYFTIDHSALFSNLVLERESVDWVNRVRLLYSQKHLDLAVLFWHNNSVFDKTTYLSGGFNIYYNRIKVASHVDLSTGLTGLVMIQSSDQLAYPKRNGVMVTVGAVFH